MKGNYEKILDSSKFVEWFMSLYAMDINDEIANNISKGTVHTYFKVGIPGDIIKLYRIQKYKKYHGRVCIPSMVTDRLVDYWYRCGWLLSVADNVPYVKHSGLKLYIIKKRHILSRNYTIIHTTIIGKVTA